MDDKVADKAVDMMDQMQHGAAMIAKQMQELAKQYGPKVVDAALIVARIDAIQILVLGFCWLIGLIICVSWVVYCIKRNTELKNRSDGGWLVVAFTTGLFPALCCCVGVVTYLFNVFAWAGVFHPEIWIAAKVMHL